MLYRLIKYHIGRNYIFSPVQKHSKRVNRN